MKQWSNIPQLKVFSILQNSMLTSLFKLQVYEKTPYKEYITSDDVFIIDSGEFNNWFYNC